jgi:Transposase family tnp2
MTRKRSISSVLEDDSSTSRPIAKPTRSSTRLKVNCFCSKCEGKLVDPRTKKKHEISSSQISIQEDIEAESSQQNTNDELYQSVRFSRQQIEVSQDTVDIEDIEEENQETDDSDINYLPRERVSRYTKLLTTFGELSINNFEQSEATESDIDIDDDNDSANNEYSEIFEDYSCPPFEPFQDSIDTEMTNDKRFLWILIWIMRFRTRFNLPETATESLIKFMKLVLREIGGSNFDTFPGSLFLAKNALGLKDLFHSFVPCQKCHKLYNKQEVENFNQDENLTVMKCQHVEFPNSTNRRSKRCQTPLSDRILLTNQRLSLKPKLIYPFAGICQQLRKMYNRPGFEKSLRHWANRPNYDDILTDIYDGQVWRTLKDNDDSSNFFRPDAADSHLGLMLNLDWFQPFDGTIHSTGVIYAAICNLPRDIRFKRENMLILGLLPGPNEVSLHRINHYLAPIIDDLESLWSGVTLNRTYECENRKRIRAALILVSCDIPAARKICGHVSALVSCHRCTKHANYENRKNNFAGMENMDDWFIARNSKEHRQNALGWRRCNSDASRNRFAKQTGVRWSELLRLPYFDPITFTIVDPMHCLFLGIARWIVKRLWIETGVLTPETLKIIQKKMNEFQIPSDLG